MKKCDLIFIAIVVALFLPFFVCDSVYEWYKTFNSEHAIVMSFLKFAILSTIGEMIGMRISSGKYITKTFGLIPRMVIWGILGVCIGMAMKIFSSGVPVFLEAAGMVGATKVLGGELCFNKVLVAFAISVAMNSIFAPVFMTFHKITDTHILNCGGSIKALVTPIPFGKYISELNWKVQWGFVFKKTIPFFWYPAHTITFLLPQEMQVLFAALLGVALGVILAVAAIKGRK
ncbi:MAG: hypothetical protein IKV14_01175 [Muribaculaceae bacterium]|nr:hypothetical protein [Muribaculaceae bacterium]